MRSLQQGVSVVHVRQQRRVLVILVAQKEEPSVVASGLRISDFMQQSEIIFGCQRAFPIYVLTRARFQIKISPSDRSPDQYFI